jgi:hypothetical protein
VLPDRERVFKVLRTFNAIADETRLLAHLAADVIERPREFSPHIRSLLAQMCFKHLGRPGLSPYIAARLDDAGRLLNWDSGNNED